MGEETNRWASRSKWSSREKKITWLLLGWVPPEADPETRIPGQVVSLGSEGNNDRRGERGDRKGMAFDQVL